MEEYFIDRKMEIDTLTQVFSREIVAEYTNCLINDNIPFSMALIDVDNFKTVNDTYGHLLGDTVLQKVAKEINTVVAEKGFVGRYGGDEFIIVFPKIIDYDAIVGECQKIIAAVANSTFSDASWLSVTITMGVARFPENAQTYENIFNFADKALYRGKRKGRNCFIIYLPETHSDIVLQTEKDISLSSMFIHSNIIKLLSHSDISEGIDNLFYFLTSYFMFDYICIQKDKKIYFEKHHQLATPKKIRPITEECLNNNKNDVTGTFYLSNIKRLLQNNEHKFFAELQKQDINAIFCCEISCCETNYGYLRVDSKDSRIWQNLDMDVLVSAAKLIGLLLHERKLSIKDLRMIY